MKTIAFVALFVVYGLTREAFPNAAQYLSVLLGGWIFYLFIRFFQWIFRSKKDRRPPTDRQLDFIDALMEEREVEPWMLAEEPKNIKEASALIKTLLAQPERSAPPRTTRRRSRASNAIEDDADFTI